MKNQSPFTVLVDSREQLEYTFMDIPADQDEGGADTTLIVPTMRLALPVGDYSILGLPQIVIERKSKEDLYGSVSSTQARSNFEGRLKKMCSENGFSLVLVESEWADLLGNPPAFTKFAPKALFRTILAWQQRYPLVHWLMMPGRDLAEIACYRVLARYWDVNHKDAEYYDQLDKLRSVQRVGGVDRIKAGEAAVEAEGLMVAGQLDEQRRVEGMSPGELTAMWATGKATTTAAAARK